MHHDTYSTPLNEVQLMLLRLFSRPMSTQDLQAIREMLIAYYENMLQRELDEVIEKKQITRSDYDKILTTDQRTV